MWGVGTSPVLSCSPPYPKRGGPSSREVLLTCKVLKQGQPVCRMSALFVQGDPAIRP